MQFKESTKEEEKKKESQEFSVNRGTGNEKMEIEELYG